MRTTRLALSGSLAALGMAASGCWSPAAEPGPPDASPDSAPPWVEAEVAAGALAAADPRLEGFDGWPLSFDLRWGGHDQLHCRLEISSGIGPVAALASGADLGAETGHCGFVWDARDELGQRVGPGSLTASLEVVEPASQEILATATTGLEVVRLGIAEIDFVEAEPGQRVQLLYGAAGGVEQGYFPVPPEWPAWRLGPDGLEPEGAVALEYADGTPRPLPSPWQGLRSPPEDPSQDNGIEQDTYNLPTAWVAGANPDIEVLFTAELAGGLLGEPSETEVRLAPPSGVALPPEGAGFSDGGSASLATEEPLAPAVGRYQRSLTWRFEARRPDGDWVSIPGAIVTEHRFYGLVAQPSFQYGSTPHAPWVEIVDLVTGWMDDASSDPIEVAGRIVEGIYYELDLVYDIYSGASAYTWYPDYGFNDAVFELSAFQTRSYGSTINCSDAGSILSTYANMVGIDFRYHILQHDYAVRFDLNYIKAIGTEAFDETPFASGGGGFRYHAVVGPADGTFYDATLALDGDGEPTAPPFTELLAAGMLPEPYVTALSSEWDAINVTYDQQVELR